MLKAALGKNDFSAVIIIDDITDSDETLNWVEDIKSEYPDIPLLFAGVNEKIAKLARTLGADEIIVFPSMRLNSYILLRLIEKKKVQVFEKEAEFKTKERKIDN